jgi:hypothetical protein
MPTIGEVKSCFAPAQLKGKSEQDFAAKLAQQMLRSNFGELGCLSSARPAIT